MALYASAVLAASATAATVGLVYFRTTFTGLPGGDSGELLAEACQLGVAHPPGYPLFIYFARAAMHVLPEAFTPAQRVNLASCGLGVATAVLLGEATAETANIVLGRRDHPFLVRSAATTSAVLAALSPHVWLYSIGTEVFALNNLLVAGLLLTVTRYAAGILRTTVDASVEAHIRRYTMLGCFLSGLALSNQHTSVLFIIPVACWVALSQLRLLTAAQALKYLAAGLAGLLPYLHMPLAHTLWRGPGSWGDTSTLRGFLRHLLRADYGTFKLISRTEGHAEGFVERTQLYATDLVNEQMPPLYFLLLLIGIGTSLATFPLVGLRVVGEASKGSRRRRAEGTEAPVRVARSLNDTRAVHAQPQPAADTKSGATPGSPSTAVSEASEGASALGDAAVRWAQGVAGTLPLLLVSAYAFYFAVFHGLSNMVLSEKLLYGVHARFWLQPNLLAFLLAGVGTAAAGSWLMSVQLEGWTLSVRQRDNNTGLMAQLTAAAVIAAVGAKAAQHQYQRHVGVVDQTGNTVMNDYGRALLDPLPRNAILITGYDMQWTATRYLQACEGLRPDVQLFNSAVMSFSWFAAHRALHPAVSFLGTHYVGHLTAPHAAGGFSLADFFAANLAADGGASIAASYDRDRSHVDYVPRNTRNIPPAGLGALGAAAARSSSASRTGGVFFTGHALLSDKAHADQFDFVPFGIVERVVPKFLGSARTRLVTWRNYTRVDPVSDVGHRIGKRRPEAGSDAEAAAAQAAWGAVTRAYNGSVSLARWGGRTWEHATRLDFWGRAVHHATWLLDWALQPAVERSSVGGGDSEQPRSVAATLGAAAILEDALRHQLEEGVGVLPSTYKNLGLAYVRLVRAQPGRPLPTDCAWPLIPGAEDAAARKDEGSLRLAASTRVLTAWRTYLGSQEARSDPGYESIVHVVGVLEKATAKRGAARTGA